MAEDNNNCIYNSTSPFKSILILKCKSCSLLFGIFTDVESYDGDKHNMSCPFCRKKKLEFDFVEENPAYNTVQVNPTSKMPCSDFDMDKLEEWHRKAFGCDV